MIRKFKIILPILCFWEIIYSPMLFLYALLCGFRKGKIDIGLGPEPLVNNFYHSRALRLYGYTTETFVDNYWYITKDFDRLFVYRNKYLRFILLNIFFIDFLHVVSAYRCIYIYFNGGSLSRSRLIWRLEPFLLKLAGIKIVVMPYGSDIQILDETPNLYYKNCMAHDYPLHKFRYSRMRERKTLWTSQADAVIGGCDWVDYLYHWDHLMVGHFSIDMDRIAAIAEEAESLDLPNNGDTSKPFIVLHAPNHRSIKGTSFVLSAINDLRAEGVNVQLVLAEKKPNYQIVQLIHQADLVIDQLVIGWYAMFAIEAMTLRKPVICYIREDLVDLYRSAGLIQNNEPPLINASVLTIKDVIRKCVDREIDLDSYGQRGNEYVAKMHSLEAVGKVFDKINRSIGISPAQS